MRRPHYLKSNKSVELPARMLFVDTESNIEQQTRTLQYHTLKMGVACYVQIRNVKGRPYYKEEWFNFTNADRFWEWVQDRAYKGNRLWVFAHNWNYDAGILKVSSWFTDNGWTCTEYINDKPPFYVSFRKAGKTIRLCDTLNYFAGSLASIGKSLGIRKLDMPPNDATQAEWWAYNKRDTYIIKEAVLALRELVLKHKLGNWQPTIASQSFSAYRHRFMPGKILIHDQEHVCQLERESYYGGRTECFYLGEVSEPMYYVDINSQYPAAMASEPMPVYLLEHVYGNAMSMLQTKLDRFAVVATVVLKTDSPVYPVRWRKRLVFPVGEFTTTLSTPELKYAFANDHVARIVEFAYYKQADIFSEYVQEIYRLRREYQHGQNGTFAYMCKILLNSLYGKFGQNGTKWVKSDKADNGLPGVWLEQDRPGDDVVRYRSRLGVVQRFQREGESQNSFPAVSAHITAYGRMMLWRLIEKAGAGHVYYCDTDSMIVDQTGYDALHDDMDRQALGKLKLEAAADSVVLWGAKDYRFGKMVKHKGIKKAARHLYDATWEQERFYSWDYLLNKGDADHIVVETVTKTLHRKYTKGIPTESGWVQPLIADGTVLDVRVCQGCGVQTQDWARSPMAFVEPYKASGWVGDKFVPYDKRYKLKTIKSVTLCAGCMYGLAGGDAEV